MDLPSTATDDSSFSSHLLGEFLLEQGLVTPEQLEQAKQTLASQSPPEALAFRDAFVPTADGKRLLVVDARTGETRTTITLTPGDSGDGLEIAPGWARYSDGLILIPEPGEVSPKRWLSTGEMPRLGVIPTAEGAFLYGGEPPRREHSPKITALPSPFLNPPGASGPLDLYPTPGGELLLATNRGGGTLHIISIDTVEQKGIVSLRPPGHQRGLGVAVSPDMKTAYLTDGLTPRLGILDLATLKIRHQLFPTGPLSALLLSADGSSLLACFAKGPREMGLLSISLPDLRVKHLLNLPGKGEGDRPGLPLMPGYDADSAFLVCYSFETRDAHYLLQIDRAKQRVTKSHPLKDMPLTLGMPSPSNWCPPPPDVGHILMQMGLIQEEHLRLAREHVVGGGEAALSLQTVPINPSVLARLPERLIRDRGVIPLNEVDGNLIVAMGNPSDPRTRQFALDLAGSLPVRVLPVTAAELDAFMDERYPALMEQFAVAEQGAAVDAPREIVSRVPQTTPVESLANAPVRAELPRVPEVPQKPASRSAASSVTVVPDDWGELPGERFLLINPLKRQVAELDKTGRSFWLYSPEGDTLTRRFSGFVHASRLPSGNTLIVDTGANRILEVNPARALVWQSREDAKLKGPRHAIRLKSGGTLVVDTGNNRLLELDAEGQVSWSFGEMGCGPNGLFKPNYVAALGNGRYLITDQGNHRVLELEPGKGVAWQYGNAPNRLGGGAGQGANQLSEPQSAVRLPSGNTLIVDGGNHRVVEIDSLGAVVWSYRAASVSRGQGVSDPVLARRLANGNTLVAGRQGLCEVDPDLAVVWEYHLVPPAVSIKTTLAKPALDVAPTPGPSTSHVAAETELPPNLPATFVQADRANHRVWEVDRTKELVWQYTGLGGPGTERGQLDRPHHVKRLKNGHVLVTDTGHHRVVEIAPTGEIVWEFGEFGRLGAGAKQLSNPRSAERLLNGNTLIADQSNRRVIEVTPLGEVVWRYEGSAQKLLAPTYATKLPDGNLLLVDWGAHMVYEVSPDGRVVWSHGQLGRGDVDAQCLFHPEHATRLPGGNTLIADTQNHRVLEVTPQGEICWQYGGQPAYYPRVGRFGLQLLTPITAWKLPTGQVVVQHAGKGHVVEVESDLSISFQYVP
ncbi:MAG: PQQ-binding-like beta-propeller repeat protein [Candidatus Sericytochromatia bacterium]|nr:PQQ-binding-like beta-propeller repeat protein [Candidatus Sericytochromatia bacterium]